MTREFVEQECAPLINAPVYYCKDAFDGLQAMERIEEAAGTTLTEPSEGNKSEVRNEDEADIKSKPDSGAEKQSGAELDSAESKAPSGTPSEASPQDESTGLASHVVPRTASYEIEHLSISFDKLLPYINRKRLFRTRWGYRRGAASEQEYLELEKSIIQPEFEKLVKWLGEAHIAPPTAAFRLLPCNRTGVNQVRIFGAETQSEPPIQTVDFHFNRQLQPPHLSVADYFLPGSAGRHDLIGLQIVTLGNGIQQEIHRLFRDDNYRDYLHLHGLAVELTEAAAEYAQQHMQSILLLPESSGSGSSVPAKRYSFGYPCCPDLTANRSIAALLKAKELGISFTEDDQMVPELSTAAFICFNPQAEYFSI